MADALPIISSMTGLSWDSDGARRISEAMGETSEALELRLDATEHLKRAPWPNATQESWRRTDPLVIGKRAFQIWHAGMDGVQPEDGADPLGINLPGSRLQMANCRLISEELEPEHRAGGVIFADLDAALRNGSGAELTNWMRRQSAPDTDSPALTLANRAFRQGGAWLKIPDRFVSLKPFLLGHRAHTPNAALFPMNVVAIGAGARITLVIKQTANTDAPSWFNGMTSIEVGDEATLNLIAINSSSESVRFYDHLEITLGRDAHVNVTWADLTRGWAVVRRDAHLNARGAEAHLHGVHVGLGDSHYDMRSRQQHPAPKTTSDLLQKVVLWNQAKSVFQGLITVAPEAIDANAYQLNRNLLMDAGARADSIPKLEILVDEVRCTHGASSGKINREALFYLMSRGVDRAAATRLIVSGFLKDAGNLLNDDLIKSFFQAHVTQVLEQAL